ncbi:glycoside hydrolase family 5 protein [Ruminococcus bicirculans (ex Wegman et al. 2014)]|uniref:glycoside hydrolase family 5 protein n=1 Tax=Ruminococcus bicirculans (ex Wegman et al. 2014) TaxID=1160721 RepID=UPI00241EE16D|nr:glycoside hydrolase family 5 protein [Ruminococcus bicirculans (ex Wegman et al. 2014)]
MRKFISRAAALLLAGVMTAAVAGCGKNSDSKAKDTAKKWTELDQTQITEAMGLGWNLGNQLEASSGGLPSETCWGNPEVTKELIDTVKAQGFKTVRIPVSYLDMIGDGPDYKIDTDWLDRVQEVVDYVVNNDMFAIVNMHGDGYYTVDHSWLLCAEDDDKQTEIKDKYGKVWTQIADRFKDYDQHLIFESMNEEFNNDYGKPDEKAYDNINAYNQIFVDSVRATGSNNEKRWLLLPGWNTNIDYTAGDDYNFKIPTDKGCKADGKRIMISVHYYDPFNFTIDENKTAKTQWGKYAVKNYDNWGQEDYVDSQMALLNEKFVSHGYPVVIGEFGAQDKTEKFADYNEFRRYWAEYLIKAAKKNGVVCVYWDNGYNGNKGFGIINRFDYTITQPDLIAGMMRAINSTDDYDIPSPAGYTEVRKSAKAS